MLNKSLHLSQSTLSANVANKANRDGFGDSLVKLAKENKDVVVLTADLRDSTRVDKFAQKFPKRFVEVGVAEQNMAGVAAGLALSGKIPIMTSFSTFSPGRNWEQIRVSICYTGANVKIISTHCGFSAAKDGATHQGLEDIALTRVLPNMTVIEPVDYQQTGKAVEELLKHEGPLYMRLNRNETPVFTTTKTPFKIGEAQIVNKGEDISVFACGTLVYTALEAARELAAKDRISVEVVNVHTIKPLDEDTIVKSVKKTGLALTLEEHQVNGGLGGAISEMLAQKSPTRILRMGAQDTFGESGDYKKLLEKHYLDKNGIMKMVKSLITAHAR
jgi:transketolase